MERREYKFYVYIVASSSGTIYIGFTNNLIRRIQEHKKGKIEGFTKKYKCKKLVYYEQYKYVGKALGREKELKKFNRRKKEILIKNFNPHWNDLFESLF